MVIEINIYYLYVNIQYYNTNEFNFNNTNLFLKSTCTY